MHSRCLPAVNHNRASPSPFLYSTDIINDFQDGASLHHMAIFRPVKHLELGHSVEFCQFFLQVHRMEVVHDNTALLFCLKRLLWVPLRVWNIAFYISHLRHFYEQFPYNQRSFLAIFSHNLNNKVTKHFFSSASSTPVRVALVLW